MSKRNARSLLPKKSATLLRKNAMLLNSSLLPFQLFRQLDLRVSSIHSVLCLLSHSLTSKSVLQAPAAPNVGLPSGSSLLAGYANPGNKIMKPKGSAGKDWNLRDQMGMSKYKEQYKAIHVSTFNYWYFYFYYRLICQLNPQRTVLRLVAHAHLDATVEYRRQDSLLIGAICRSVRIYLT